MYPGSAVKAVKAVKLSAPSRRESIADVVRRLSHGVRKASAPSSGLTSSGKSVSLEKHSEPQVGKRKADDKSTDCLERAKRQATSIPGSYRSQVRSVNDLNLSYQNIKTGSNQCGEGKTSTAPPPMEKEVQKIPRIAGCNDPEHQFSQDATEVSPGIQFEKKVDFKFTKCNECELSSKSSSTLGSATKHLSKRRLEEAQSRYERKAVLHYVDSAGPESLTRKTTTLTCGYCAWTIKSTSKHPEQTIRVHMLNKHHPYTAVENRKPSA